MAEYQTTKKQREIIPCGAGSCPADSSHIAWELLALNGTRIAGLVYRSESVHQTPATHGAAPERVLHQHGVADKAHCQAFDLEGLTRLHHDHRVVGVLGQ